MVVLERDGGPRLAKEPRGAGPWRAPGGEDGIGVRIARGDSRRAAVLATGPFSSEEPEASASHGGEAGGPAVSAVVHAATGALPGHVTFATTGTGRG